MIYPKDSSIVPDHGMGIHETSRAREHTTSGPSHDAHRKNAPHSLVHGGTRRVFGDWCDAVVANLEFGYGDEITCVCHLLSTPFSHNSQESKNGECREKPQSRYKYLTVRCSKETLVPNHA